MQLEYTIPEMDQHAEAVFRINRHGATYSTELEGFVT